MNYRKSCPKHQISMRRQAGSWLSRASVNKPIIWILRNCFYLQAGYISQWEWKVICLPRKRLSLSAVLIDLDSISFWFPNVKLECTLPLKSCIQVVIPQSPPASTAENKQERESLRELILGTLTKTVSSSYTPESPHSLWSTRSLHCRSCFGPLEDTWQPRIERGFVYAWVPHLPHLPKLLSFLTTISSPVGLHFSSIYMMPPAFFPSYCLVLVSWLGGWQIILFMFLGQIMKMDFLWVFECFSPHCFSLSFKSFHANRVGVVSDHRRCGFHVACLKA